MTPSQLLEKVAKALEAIYEHTKVTLKRMGSLQAHPEMLEAIRVDYHGVPTPIREIANIDVANNRMLQIVPWDKQNLDPIVKGIYTYNNRINKHYLHPENTGQMVRVTLPALTEELRKEVVEDIKKQIEQSKRKILEERRDTNETLKELNSQGSISEDEYHYTKDRVQKLIDNYTDKMRDLQQKKEAEIMKL